MNKVKRLARKRLMMQTFNNPEVAEQLADIRKVPLQLTRKDIEAGFSREYRIIEAKIFQRQLAAKTPKNYSRAITFNESRRQEWRKLLLSMRNRRPVFEPAPEWIP